MMMFNWLQMKQDLMLYKPYRNSLFVIIRGIPTCSIVIDQSCSDSSFSRIIKRKSTVHVDNRYSLPNSSCC